MKCAGLFLASNTTTCSTRMVCNTHLSQCEVPNVQCYVCFAQFALQNDDSGSHGGVVALRPNPDHSIDNWIILSTSIQIAIS